MKRSRSVALISMGVSALVLSACDNTPKEVHGAVFTSIEECQASGTYNEAQCTEAFSQAVDQHETDAKKYASLRDCEFEFGAEKCQNAPSEGSERRYRPGFSGFFIGAMLGQALARPVYPPAPGASGFRTATNTPISAKAGAVTVPTHALSRAPGSSTVARAGFGSTGRTASARS